MAATPGTAPGDGLAGDGSTTGGRSAMLLQRTGLQLLRAAGTLLGVAAVVFVVLRLLPGNQITGSLGVSAGLLTAQQRAALDQFYGIGKPIPQQFLQWLGDLLHGNLGLSVQNGQSVNSLLRAALPVTVELAVASLLIGLVLGVGFGVLAASGPGRWRDRLAQAFALLGLGVPSFVIGSGLVAVFATVFHYFPASKGYAGLLQNPSLNVQQIFFPALTLGLGVGAAIMRTTRGAMLEVTRTPFVRAARGKGLAEYTIIVRHVLRNALVPITTMSGIQFGYLLGGTVIVEQIFVLPGLGRLLLSSVNNRDYAVAEGVTLLFAGGFVLVNVLTDALYAVIDPRVRQ